MGEYRDIVRSYSDALDEWEHEIAAMESWMSENVSGTYDAETVQQEITDRAPRLAEQYSEASGLNEDVYHLKSGLELLLEDELSNIPELPGSTGLQERAYSRIENLDDQYAALEDRQTELAERADNEFDTSINQHLETATTGSYLDRLRQMDVNTKLGAAGFFGIGATVLREYLKDE